jgi:serine/threonine protein kinase
MIKGDSSKTAASDFDNRLLRTEFLNKKYQVLSKLGKGGFGEILMVKNIETHKILAIKKQSKIHEKSKRTEQKVMDEFKMMKNIKSSFIPEQIETF